MKKNFKIAIVGRPNVGKSALFNRVCEKRIAIVDEEEGITRDRLYGVGEIFGKSFYVIDTGGIDNNTARPFNEEVKRQAQLAIEEADALILVVDGLVGVTALDEEVAQLLLRAKKPLYLAVNKIDTQEKEGHVGAFYALGIKDVLGISALHGVAIAELLTLATQSAETAIETKETMRVAIVGRPNVGKSTLVNYLLQENRCVVSPIAGTTRDAVDIEVVIDGSTYTLIDTAGIRKKQKEKELVEKFAAMRTQWAISRASVCIVVLDANVGITAYERHIIRMVEELGKGCVLFFNKWDLVKGYRMEHCQHAAQLQTPFFAYAPKIFGSALTGRAVDSLFREVAQVFHNLNLRISTGRLNKVMESALQRLPPPMIKAKRLRVYYASQVQTGPPKFVLFVNYIGLMTENYKRYLLHQFRKVYPFTGVPLFFYLKKKKERSKKQADPDVEKIIREKLVSPVDCHQSLESSG